MKIIYNIFENISNNTYYYYTRMLSCLKEIIPNAVQQATNHNSDNYDYSLIPEQTEQSTQTPSTQSTVPSTQSTVSSTQSTVPSTQSTVPSTQSIVPSEQSTQSEPSEQTSSEPSEPSTQSSIIYSTISKNFSIYRNTETSEFKEPLLTNSSES